MDHIWDYDATPGSLFDPGNADDFFRLAPRYHPPALAAEMARLVYCSDLNRVSLALRRAGYGDPLWFREKGTDAFLTRSADMAVLVFRGTEGPKLRHLTDPARLQRAFAQSGFDWTQAAQSFMAGLRPDMQEVSAHLMTELQDLLTDLDFVPTDWRVDGAPGGRVHRGFAQALDRVWEPIANQLAGLDMPVIFAGHSLGAALATLAASRHAPETLYTFGSPTVGDADFAKTLQGTVVYRYMNCADLVCRMPPALYAHVGTLRYIDSAGRLVHAAESEADQLAAWTEHFQATMAQWDKLWLRGLIDHAPVNYVRALLNGQK